MCCGFLALLFALSRHSREGGNPATLLAYKVLERQKKSHWIPAFAGMTA
jgi:hypothetical protein